jgi:hypothetical protein
MMQRLEKNSRQKNENTRSFFKTFTQDAIFMYRYQKNTGDHAEIRYYSMLKKNWKNHAEKH